MDFCLISFPIVYGCSNNNVTVCANNYTKREKTFSKHISTHCLAAILLMFASGMEKQEQTV